MQGKNSQSEKGSVHSDGAPFLGFLSSVHRITISNPYTVVFFIWKKKRL